MKNVEKSKYEEREKLVIMMMQGLVFVLLTKRPQIRRNSVSRDDNLIIGENMHDTEHTQSTNVTERSILGIFTAEVARVRTYSSNDAYENVRQG